MNKEQIIFGIVGLVAFILSILVVNDWKIWVGMSLLVFANNLGLKINNQLK